MTRTELLLIGPVSRLLRTGLLLGPLLIGLLAGRPAAAQRAPEVRLQGSLSASSTSYTSAGIDSQRDPFTWILNGNAVLRVGSISFPFSAIVSEQESAFRQPFNRYGVSPTYRSVKLHLGYRSLTFSPYTLGGATFRGAGVEVNPGRLRLAAMYGRFRRAVEEDTVRTRRSVPAYRRTGFGLKLGVGSETSYVDLILFRAIDDTSSLDRAPVLRDIRPAENAVVGLSSRIRISPAVRLEGEVAGSAFTRDVRSPLLEDAEDLPSIVTSLFSPRLSSTFSLAYRGAVDVSRRTARVRLQFERVDPGYETLGAYYFANDIQNITIAPSFELMGGRLRLGFSGGLQRDNLDGKRLATTRRAIGSANAAWQPTPTFGLNAQLTNHSSGRRNSGQEALVDTIRIEDVSRSISLMPRLTLPKGALTHSISGGLSAQRFRQRNLVTDLEATTQLLNLRATYSLSPREHAWTAGLTLNRTGTETAGISLSLFGASLFASTSLFDQNLTLSGSFGMLSRRFEDEDAEMSMTADVDVTFAASPLDQFALRSGYGNNPSLPLEGQRFSELITTITYRRRFDL